MDSHLYKRIWVLTLLSFLFMDTTAVVAQATSTQAPIVKLGRVTAADFDLAASGLDSTAEAEVLYDHGSVRFDLRNNTFIMEFTRHRRIRILKKSALNRGTVEIPTFKGEGAEREYMVGIDGYTHNLNGQNVTTDKLTRAGMVSERVSDQVTLEKFTLPNVREGSIIEYRYVLQTPFSVAHNPRTWAFQEEIPVRWSEYNITIPNYFYYKIIMGGYLGLTEQKQRSVSMNLLPGVPDTPAIVYHFAIANVPALESEDYITTTRDYTSKVEFELAKVQIPNGLIKDFTVSWETLDKTLLMADWFGNQYKKAPFLRDVATLIRSQNPTDSLARLSAAYDYIRKSIKWDGSNSYSCKSTRKIFEAKKGDAGDINLLLIALLRELDFDANPVLLSTRSHGRVMEEYALTRQFDYVVAHVHTNGQEIMLDATDPFIKMGMLPKRCLNQTGRLVVPDQKSRFVSLLPTERDTELTSGQFTLADDGEVKGTMKHSRGGYSGWSARSVYQTDGEAKYLEQILKKRPNWQLNTTEITGVSNPAAAFESNHTLVIADAYTEAGDRIYLNPMLTEGRTQNPFKEKTRLYPVDFGAPIEEAFMATFTLPQGFAVEELPKAAVISLPDKAGRFSYQVLHTGNQLQVVSRLSLRKPIYFAEEYGALRELFALIVTKHAERVVLKRGEVAKK
ncbi:DUF3857 domain-containing protein [Rudanella paleaurantiibacter]|uniref:DUF3857 domain-containing protein n=1 Tax=Rudanella paleaurantiibacter TaxID=2614655 RepID=A0A7J5U5Y3_9BACT|nr:transglutaminase domain-containing protein [Rudanella paleaurantiibacter]KAB7733093.1 DUF3857 domain-containing protein [Rudanella paleaurantiibacter]